MYAVDEKRSGLMKAVAALAVLLLTVGLSGVLIINSDRIPGQDNIWVGPGSTVTPLYDSNSPFAPIGYSVVLQDRATVCTMTPDDKLYTCVSSHLRR